MMLSFVRKKNKKIQTADELIDSINKFIEKNYTKKISLDLIADAVHANRCYTAEYIRNGQARNCSKRLIRKKLKLPRNILKTER